MNDLLKQYYEDCFHVDDIGLQVPATDDQIWRYEKENALIIITNDEDFVDLINIKGFPPKVVLLRVGNENKSFIANLLIEKKREIEALNSFELIGLLV
jgi:predicted nuclease of predicted toxin-antitoxin system